MARTFCTIHAEAGNPSTADVEVGNLLFYAQSTIIYQGEPKWKANRPQKHNITKRTLLLSL